MKDIGQVLGSGLKRWVEQGVCPQELVAQIEASICTARRQPWWRRWPAYASLAVVAAVLLVVMVGGRLNLGEAQIAGLPLVGSLAAQLFYTEPDQMTGLANARVTVVNQSDEHGGMKLVVHRLAVNKSVARVQFSLQGTDLVAQGVDPSAPTLEGSSGPIKLKQAQATRQGDRVEVIADFEAIPHGQTVTLTVGGDWQVTIVN